MSDLHAVAAVEGWFTVEPSPRLIGAQCPVCTTYVFPPRDHGCPNPHCGAADLDRVELSSHGTLWSYAENRYAPPPPYVAAEPFEPYALAAVELEREGLIILGQVPKGVLAADLHVGMRMQLEVGPLLSADGVDRLVYMWAPAAPAPPADQHAQTSVSGTTGSEEQP